MAVVSRQPEQLEPTAAFRRANAGAWFVGGAGLLAAMMIGYFSDRTLNRFFHAYLVSYAFFLSISMGAIFFVLMQHLTRAGWSVGARRTAETLACAMPMFFALSAPIVLAVIMQRGELYTWANRVVEGGKHAVELEGMKKVWLTPGFFLIRLAIYLGVWSVIGVWYWRQSVRQDSSRDPELTHSMQRFAPASMVVFAITLTIGSFDILMSLDPHWFSTMFGVYFFAGCAVSIYASLIVILFILQASGYVTRTITIEHFHDLGKFLFAFTFFWGYIAFSQFMLLWYANIPEETEWFVRRGASSAVPNAWTPILIALLFGHLLIPFIGLLSRHMKRQRKVLLFWAIWLLTFHWLDLYWVIMPQLDGEVHFGPIEVLCFFGIGGCFTATIFKIALLHNLRPISDPRLQESLVFENI